MSYSTDIKGAIRASAEQAAEILRGGNPAEMPYFKGTRFALVINLKTAKRSGSKCQLHCSRVPTK
jgi:putative ABC transport system substrate-binding protein